MHLCRVALPALLCFAPAFLHADATIRYAGGMTNLPSAAGDLGTVIYMKGNKGVTITGDSVTIVDFVKHEVTMIDTARKKYAIIPVADYSSQMEKMMPAAGMDPLKTMKTTCDSQKTGAVETIQGVKTEEREIDCSVTMPLPERTVPEVAAALKGMTMKLVVKQWTALPAERLRLPALWQLSGFELWQKYFMNPFGAPGSAAMGGMAPLAEALGKDDSLTLRSSMEMSMDLPGATAAAAPMMNMTNEVTELSTAPLDDSLFAIPSDASAAPFGEVMNGLTQSRIEASRKPAAGIQTAQLPANIKAYVPALTPLTQKHPELPEEARARDIYGSVELLITVGPKGTVEQTEVLSGPEELRKAATESLTKWTFRPVLRGGSPVTAYTTASVNFFNPSGKGAPNFALTPDMATAAQRLTELEAAMPRTPQQIFEDLEQDAGGRGTKERLNLLGPLALAALKADVNDKADYYAKEMLTAAEADHKAWNYGDAIHDGHSILGVVALRNNDITTARQQLLEAGKTPGSPVLDSFGPNMILASELLKKGERDVVLDYLELCRAFWKSGPDRLDSWKATISRNETPVFGGNLR